MPDREVSWPNGKQAAALVSIELDSEFIWLDIDPTNIDRPKTLSMGTYGMKRGLGRVLESLERHGIKATFFVPGIVARNYPDEVLRIDAAGHEIALHGFAHENFGLLDPARQREVIKNGISEIARLIGRRPSGFRLPEGNMTPETLGILNDMGFQYDCSMLDSDLPYRIAIDGREEQMLEIPMRWDMQDFTYFAFNFHPPVPAGVCRIANYRQVLSIWMDELQGYYEYGLCYVCKFDPQTIGTPGRIGLLDALLDDMRQKDIWIAPGREIADFCQRERMG